MNQIADWLGHLGDHKRGYGAEVGLTGISTNPRTLIIIGRSDTLTDDNRRKLHLQSTNPKLRILTYDDVLAAVAQTSKHSWTTKSW